MDKEVNDEFRISIFSEVAVKKKSSFGVANSDYFFPFLLAGRISKA